MRNLCSLQTWLVALTAALSPLTMMGRNQGSAYQQLRTGVLIVNLTACYRGK